MANVYSHVRIIAFTSKSCGFCEEMERKRVLERAQERFTGLKVIKLITGDEDGEVSTPEYEKNVELAEAYEAEGLPTLIVESKLPDGQVMEIQRVDGAPTFRELADFLEGLTPVEEHTKIPW